MLGFGWFLQALWAALFLWYVVERLRVAKGEASEPPVWHNPIAAARRFWRDLWDNAQLAWGLLAAILGAYGVACIGLFLWGCATESYGAEIGAGPLRSLLQMRPEQFRDLILHPGLWNTTWRELLDAATVYPAFELGFAARPITAIALAAIVTWIIVRRRQIAAAKALSPAQVSEAYGYLGAGLLAIVVSVILVAIPNQTAGQDVRLFGAFVTLLSVPVAQGGVLGLASLALADVVSALPLYAEGIVRRWLRLLPSFVLLAGVAVLPRVVGDLVLPGWETDRATAHQATAAALWAVTRLAWLGVVPVWLWVVFERRPLLEALGQAPGFWKRHWRAVGMAILRTVVVLGPVLLGLRLLETLAPATSLFPGAAVVLGSWIVGLVVLGSATEMYRAEFRSQESGVRMETTEYGGALTF